MALTERVGPESASKIQTQSSSYRQGLILGLTMAEIMLLLVFCLLIAFASVFKVQQEAKTDLQRQNEKLAAQVKNQSKFAELAERLKGLAKHNGKNSDEMWRELVENSEVLNQLKRDGVTVAELREAVENRATVKEFERLGIDPKNAAEWRELVEAITRSFNGHGETNVSKQRIIEVVERGQSLPLRPEEGHRWPPSIQLSDASGHFFKTGSAQLEPEFQSALETSVASRLRDLVSEYKVDVIEVIGHTDEQPIAPRSSNLDRALPDVVTHKAQVGSLVAADNAGLGLARAVAVVGVLSQDAVLAKLRLLPLSGAQLIRTDERLITALNPSDARERRRIEIRLRKHVEQDNDNNVATALTPARPQMPARSIDSPRRDASARARNPQPRLPISIIPPSLGN